MGSTDTGRCKKTQSNGRSWLIRGMGLYLEKSLFQEKRPSRRRPYRAPTRLRTLGLIRGTAKTRAAAEFSKTKVEWNHWGSKGLLCYIPSKQKQHLCHKLKEKKRSNHSPSGVVSAIECLVSPLLLPERLQDMWCSPWSSLALGNPGRFKFLRPFCILYGKHLIFYNQENAAVHKQEEHGIAAANMGNEVKGTQSV